MNPDVCHDNFMFFTRLTATKGESLRSAASRLPKTRIMVFDTHRITIAHDWAQESFKCEEQICLLSPPDSLFQFHAVLK